MCAMFTRNLKGAFILNLVLAVFLCTLDTASAQTIEVVPNRVLFDESAVIHVTGLQPKEEISLQAELKDGAGETWTSKADFLATRRGPWTFRNRLL
jgi:hypothetical protein